MCSSQQPPLTISSHPCLPNTQAWARPGSLAYDPYCGTGSVLIAAARMGSYVVGGDIDMRVLKLGRPNQKTGQVRGSCARISVCIRWVLCGGRQHRHARAKTGAAKPKNGAGAVAIERLALAAPLGLRH